MVTTSVTQTGHPIGCVEFSREARRRLCAAGFGQLIHPASGNHNTQAAAQLNNSSGITGASFLPTLRFSKLAAVEACLVEEEYLLDHRMWLHFVGANQ